MENKKAHKPFSPSNISDNLFSKRKTRKQSKNKPSKTPNLLLNVIEDTQPQHEDYKSFIIAYSVCVYLLLYIIVIKFEAFFNVFFSSL